MLDVDSVDDLNKGSSRKKEDESDEELWCVSENGQMVASQKLHRVETTLN